MPVFRFLARRSVAALTVLALAIAGGYLLLGRSSAEAAILTVTRADVPTEVAATGSVVAASSADLGFAAGGRIQGTYAKVGAHVAAGTVLAEIENADQAAEVARKRAALKEAQARLASLMAGMRPEEVAIDEAAVASAESALAQSIKSAYVAADDAVRNRSDVIFVTPRSMPRVISLSLPAALEDTLERERAVLNQTLGDWQRSLSSLASDTAAAAAERAAADLAYIETFLDHVNTALSRASSGQISQATIGTYETSVAAGRTSVAAAAADLATKVSALASAEKVLTLAKAGPTSADLTAEQAAVAAALADLENARAALGKTQVVAPFDGIVTRMDAKTGEVVSSSASAISMQSDALYQVEVYIPEVSIAGVTPGDLATTTLDAYGSAAAFAARVVLVDPAETLKDGVPTYKTTLAFAEQDSRVRSGMTADVRITTGVLPGAIVLPEGAVARDAGGAYVSVLSGKKAERRAVVTGAVPSLGTVEVVSGLESGETILLTPQ